MARWQTTAVEATPIAGWVMGRRRLGVAALVGVTALASASCGGARFGFGPDCSGLDADGAGEVAEVADDFGGDGPLTGYVTNNPDALPDVAQVDGRYRAVVVDNSQDQTLHFFSAQGRLDARLVAFPFDYVARNVGIGTTDDSQTAPAPVGDDTYIFAGVQVHDVDLEARNSSHIVVGHRGSSHYTVEGKNTCDAESVVTDIGPGVAPSGRVDLRIVGNDDRTLSVYYQEPNADFPTQPDDWQPYEGSGRLPGEAPDYGDKVYIGLITSAQGELGVPYVGTADSIEDYSQP